MSSDTRQRKWAAILFTDMVACGALARPEEKPTQELREGRLAPYALNSRTKNIPMKTPTQYRLFLFAMFAVSGSAAPLLTELTSDNRLLIRRAGAPAPLLIQNARADSRPFIHPLAAPDGNGVLTEDSPAHHKWQHGLYVGLNQVNGHDFWKRDEVFHPKPMAPPKVSGHRVWDKFLNKLRFSLEFEGTCLVYRHMANIPLDFSTKRAALLQKMAALDSMEVGSIKAEYRTNSSGQKSGPYFKHQVWEDGANLSQRVSTSDGPKLQEAIENRQKFEQLSADFIAVTVEQTRQEHSPLELKKKRPSPRLSKPRKPSSTN